MGKRIVFAGVAAGVFMFLWSGIAHMALPLGRVGFQQVPNEEAFLAFAKTNLGTGDGLYYFPYMNDHGADAMKAMEQKLATNPSGLLLYHPPGGTGMAPSQLVLEFLTECLEALLAVFLLSKTRLATFGARMGFVTGIGLVATITTNVPYWNWYGFPADFTIVALVVQLVMYAIAGAVAAFVLRKSAFLVPGQTAQIR